MKIKYVYRIDDIHPAMMWNRFNEVMAIMENSKIIPLLGVIPDCRDESICFDEANPDFFEIIKRLTDTGKVEICQHGYQHVYRTKQKSMNQIFYGRSSNSEFVGETYQKQYEMIKAGKERLEKQGLFTDIWMAPSHTNDDNTFLALKNLGFKYVTDGIALYPFRKKNLLFVPQQLWQPKIEFPFNFGVFTICLHLNDLSDQNIQEISAHLKSGHEIISFSEALKIHPTWLSKGFNAVYKVKKLISYRIASPMIRKIIPRNSSSGS